MRVSQFLIVVPMLAQIALILGVGAGALLGRVFSREGDCRLNGGDGGSSPIGRWKLAFNERLGLPLLFLLSGLLAYSLRLIDERVLFVASVFVFADGAAAVLRILARGPSCRAERRVAAAQFVGLLAIAALSAIIAAHFVRSGF